MVEAGYLLDGELLALAAASHSGEPFHLDGVRRVLASAGLTVGRPADPAGPAAGRGRPAGTGCAPAAAPSRSR